MAARFLLLALGLALTCSGCATLRDVRLAPQRSKLMALYQDTTRPLGARVEAFDLLLTTFSGGTAESTVDRFVGSVAVSRSRLSGPPDSDVENWTWKPGGSFSLRVIAPDGSDRWITLHDDRVAK